MANGHAGSRDDQMNARAIVATANGHSESASSLSGPGSGQKTATGSVETAHGQRGNVTSHCESSFVHEWSVERERDPRNWAHDPRDRERAQRRSSRSSRPLEGDEQEEHEWERERSPVEPPISQEGDRRSPPAETEESTGERVIEHKRLL